MTLIDMSALERSREENPKLDNWFSCALNSSLSAPFTLNPGPVILGIKTPPRQSGRQSSFWQSCGGEGGIRTHEGLLTLAGFQDRCIQPLCHLSKLSNRFFHCSSGYYAPQTGALCPTSL